jgi:diguanylate cyclase (GGDEF)-like protein
MSKIGNEYIDDLTGLSNRRYLNVKAYKKIEEAKHKRKPLSVLIIDLDHFKNVNDSYGHSFGDVVLKEFSKFLYPLLRSDDTVFRYGGDEFVCILLNTDYKQAERFSHRLIKMCREKKFSKIGLTLSIGISSFPRDAKSWKGLFDIADRNLYSAKRHGRDRIGIFEVESKGLNIPTAEIVGRDEEIGRVKEFVAPIFKGKGGAVCISGEIGVGKTRLVQEIAKDADFHNIQFLSSSLSTTTRSISYYPFREIARAVIEDCGMGFIEGIPRIYQIELMKIVPELSTRIEEKGHIYMVDKFRFFEGVRKFLECRASDVPLFICLDNVHWADDVSLDLLYYLVRTLRDTPVYFFLVYRIEEARGGSFPNVLSFMSREGLYERVELESLKKPDVARILSFILDCNPSSELTEYIIKETGGNPFFIEELMKSLKANDALLWNKGEWAFKKDSKVIIPYSVEGVVERKLEIIEDESYNLLEYGAVIGREFDFNLLQDITGMNEGHLFDLMDGVVKVRLLKELGGEHYYFSKDIIREIIYGNIGSAKLKRYHQKVGEKLLDLYKGRIEEIVEELAYHFYEGGDRKNAIEYSIIAGDRARDAYANQDAIRFYSMAIEYLSGDRTEGEEVKNIECLRNRAKVLRLTGENEKAIVDLEETIERAREIGNKKEEADSLFEISNIYIYISEYKVSFKMANLAMSIYKEIRDLKGEVRTLNTIGNIHWYLCEYSEALKFYQNSLKIAEEINERRSKAKSINNIGVTYDSLGEYQKALKYHNHSLKIYKDICDLSGKAKSYNNIGVIYDNLGEYSKALGYYQRSLKIIKQIGGRSNEATILNNIAIIYDNLGKYSKALKFHKHSLEIKRETRNRRGEAVSLNNIGRIYCDLGNYKKALENYKYSLTIRKEINDHKSIEETFNSMGAVNYYLGNYSKAMNLYKHSLKIAKEIGDCQTEISNLLSIGRIFIEKNDFSAAEKNYDMAFSIAKNIKFKMGITDAYIGRTLLYLERNNLIEVRKGIKHILSLSEELGTIERKATALCLSGRLYTKEKKWNKAKSSFSESISLLKKLKRKYEIAEVYYYQGLMFNESGDKIIAEEYYAKAKTIFKDIGAKGWIEKIKAK